MHLYDSGSHVISSMLPACPARFRGLFKKKEKNIADSRVQKQSLLWKSENVCHNCGTKQGHPLHRSVHGLKQRQYGLLQAIPGCIIPDIVNRTFGNRTYVPVKSKLQHPPPGQPPGICIFCKMFVQIPPSQGRKAVQMPHHRSIPGDQMPPPPGNFSVAFIMLRKLCM